MNSIRTLLRPVLAAALLAFTALVHGQGVAPLFSITQFDGYPVCPDTVYHGQVVTLQIGIQNAGLDTVTNTQVYIHWMNFDTSLTVFQEDIDSLFVQFMPPAGSDTLTTAYTFDSLRYASGSNIVVVWPRIANSASNAADSVQFQVCFNPVLTLIAPAGRSERPLVLMPNPAEDRFSLDVAPSEHLEYVRIWDPSGRLILLRHDAGPYGMEGLPPGLFLVEVKLRNRDPIRRKLLLL